MKLFITLFALIFSLQSNAQKGWTEANGITYTVKHPKTWTAVPPEHEGEMTLTGPTPDFEEKSEYIGTTLYIGLEVSHYSTIDSVASAYKEKVLSFDFLTNINFQKEEKITFKGVDAVAITFSAKVQTFSTYCKIILFQKDGIYYEVSVTSDPRLSKKLLKEAYKVMDTFEFNN